MFRKSKVSSVQAQLKEGSVTSTRVLVLGCGPAGLGLLVRAAREEKLETLLERTPTVEENGNLAAGVNHSKDRDFGLMVVDGSNEHEVGGGKLSHYLTRSNTSSARFVRSVIGNTVDVGGSTSSDSAEKHSDSQADRGTTGSRLSDSGKEEEEKKEPGNPGPAKTTVAELQLGESLENSVVSRPARFDSIAESTDIGASGVVALGTVPYLEKVEEDTTAVELLRYGKYHTPLNRVGSFFNQAALPAIKEFMETKKRGKRKMAAGSIMHDAEVESVHIQHDGTYMVTIRRFDLLAEKARLRQRNPNTPPGLEKKEIEEKREGGADGDGDDELIVPVPRCKIHARRLVFALGGKQTIPNWLLKVARDDALCITSDVLLTRPGFQRCIDHIREFMSFPTKRSQEFSPLVAVIGGSHSAFSAAWLLLNGPACGSNEIVSPRVAKKAVEAPEQGAMAEQLKWRKAGKVGMGLGQTFPSPSAFPPGTWGFRRNDVAILHRSKIKVHFSCDAEARSVGYHYLPDEAQGEYRKSIYPFRGLRGDAKRLWMDKKDGSERRLQLKELPTPRAMADTLRTMRPLVVVWAGGYAANTVPIFDPTGKPVQIVKDNAGQLVTTSKAQMLVYSGDSDDGKKTGFDNMRRRGTAGRESSELAKIKKELAGLQRKSGQPSAFEKMDREFPLPNCYSIGLGSGLPASHEGIGGERQGGTRADGFNLYVGANGKLVLDAVLGKSDPVHETAWNESIQTNLADPLPTKANSKRVAPEFDGAVAANSSAAENAELLEVRPVMVAPKRHCFIQ